MKEKKTREKTVAEELIEGFTELADHLEAGGEIEEKFTHYHGRLDILPTEYPPARVKETREMLHASQAVFAAFLGVSVKTVRLWEQGGGAPSPMARRFMDELRIDCPRAVARIRAAAAVRIAARLKSSADPKKRSDVRNRH